MSKSTTPAFVVDVTDVTPEGKQGFYSACWPREAGRPSAASLADYVARSEAMEGTTITSAIVRRNVRGGPAVATFAAGILVAA